MAAVAVESIDAIGRFSGELRGALERLLDLSAAARLEWDRACEEAAGRVERARARLRDCEEQLSSARAVLASCRSQVTKEGEAPDCSSEEGEVEEAQRAVHRAESAVEEAVHQQGRIIDAGQEIERQAALVAAWVAGAGPQSQAALARAVDQLRGYVAAAPPAGRAAVGASAGAGARATSAAGAPVPKWFSWPAMAATAVVSPAQILQRFRVSPDELREITRHLCTNDARFREEIERRRSDYRAAAGKADRDAVYVQATKQCAGLWAEKFVEYALAPLAEKVRLQRYVGDPARAGRKGTVTDVVLEGLLRPVIFGRGAGAGVLANGTLAIEIKAGRKDYLFSELKHMQAQVAGHRGESASLCLLSRDLKDLSRARQRELRSGLRGSGSRVFAFLPRKEVIDQLCWEQICAGQDPL